MDCYSSNVVETYKRLVSCWQTFTSEDLAKLPNHAQPMFFVLKPKFRKSDLVWFLKSPVNKNLLGKTVKTLAEGILEINTEGQTFTNKIARHIGVTQMEEGLVPIEKGMRVIGHRDMKSYSKYIACVPDSN